MEPKSKLENAATWRGVVLYIVLSGGVVYLCATRQYVLAIAVAGILVILYSRIEVAYAVARHQCRKVLRARPDGELDKEYEMVQAAGGLGLHDIARLWSALANFYGVDPAKIRAHDRLRVELGGVFLHVDYDVFFCTLAMSSRTAAEAHLGDGATWANLITLLHKIEKEKGREGTRRVAESNGGGWRWVGD